MSFGPLSGLNNAVALDPDADYPVYQLNWSQSGGTNSLMLAWNGGFATEATTESDLATMVTALVGISGVSNVVLTKYDLSATQLYP